MKRVDLDLKFVVAIAIVGLTAGAPRGGERQAPVAPSMVSGWLQQAPQTSPAARAYHAMAYDLTRARTVLFGGQDASHAFRSDTWEWDGTIWAESSSSVTPPARDFPAMAYDSARGRVVMFGGYNASGLLGDTWEWDGTDWVQMTPTTNPTARYGHSLAYDSSRGRVVLFGGTGSAGILGDTWEWDGTDWVDKTPATGPAARYHHALAFDADHARVVLFGGFDGGDVRADTWEWDGAAWVEKASTTNPSARYGHSMTYDSARGRIVLFGGYNGAILGDTWEWDGSGWTETTPSGSPSPRLHPALAYDGSRDRVVLFGGASASAPFGDTWLYAIQCGADGDCDDANPCTRDFCSNAGTPAAACAHENIVGPCNDGNACTADDSCSNGTCTAVPRNCDDGNDCTLDSCDPATGCRHDPDPSCHPALDCSSAHPSDTVLWPPNSRMAPVTIDGVSNPGGTVTYEVTGITQDEPVVSSSDTSCPDGAGIGSDTAFLRVERNGGTDGRVYAIAFTAHDAVGGTCSGTVSVCVPHNSSSLECGNQGTTVDSTGPCGGKQSGSSPEKGQRRGQKPASGHR